MLYKMSTREVGKLCIVCDGYYLYFPTFIDVKFGGSPKC